MFLCQISKTVSAPREKPLRVVIEERPVTYTNVIEDELKTTHGHEIVREVDATLRSVDPVAADRVATAQRPVDAKAFISLAVGRFEHARRCKKPLDDCTVCKQNMEFFNGLPLHVLTRVCEEPQIRRGSNTPVYGSRKGTR